MHSVQPCPGGPDVPPPDDTREGEVITEPSQPGPGLPPSIPTVPPAPAENSDPEPDPGASVISP